MNKDFHNFVVLQTLKIRGVNVLLGLLFKGCSTIFKYRLKYLVVVYGLFISSFMIFAYELLFF